MTKRLRSRFITVILTLVIIGNLLPMNSVTSKAADSSLINVKGPDTTTQVTPVAGDTDNNGNTYVTGFINGTGTVDFGGSNTIAKKDADSGAAAFITKYNSSGNCSWVRSIGSSKGNSATSYGDKGTAIKTDSSGNVYASGNYICKFDFGQDGVYDAIEGHSSNPSGYLTKLNSNGELQWVITIIASGDVEANVSRMDIDSNGDIYLTGLCANVTSVYKDNNTTAVTTFGTEGKNGLYVMKINSSGVVEWVLSGTGNGSNLNAYGIAIDNTNSCVYAVGQFYKINLPDPYYQTWHCIHPY
jgi:hypothetical protein